MIRHEVTVWHTPNKPVVWWTRRGTAIEPSKIVLLNTGASPDQHQIVRYTFCMPYEDKHPQISVWCSDIVHKMDIEVLALHIETPRENEQKKNYGGMTPAPDADNNS